MMRPYSQSPSQILEKLLFIRMVEETIAEKYSDQEMRCPVHLSIGQETAAVGVCSALTMDDQIISNHRSHAHYLAMGGDLLKMIAELHGKASGCCGGRGGSMHLFDEDAGVIASLPIVSAGIPLASGIALAKKQQKKPGIIVVFFGDGAVEEGVFHETLNFAKVKGLPILFVCENNQFSVYTGLEDRQPSQDFTRFADANLIKSHRVSAMQINDVIAHTQNLRDYIIENSSPAFLQVDTYRWLEHCGPNADDHLGYRDDYETQKWIDNCPIESYKKSLFEMGIVTTQEFSELENKHRRIIDETFSKVNDLPFPDIETIKDHVYA